MKRFLTINDIDVPKEEPKSGPMRVGDRLPDPNASKKSKDKAVAIQGGEADLKNNVRRFNSEQTNNDWAAWNDQHRGQGGKGSGATLQAAKASAIAGVTGTEKSHRQAVAAHKIAASTHDKMYRKSGDPAHATVAASHRDQAESHAYSAVSAKHAGVMDKFKSAASGALSGAKAALTNPATTGFHTADGQPIGAIAGAIHGWKHPAMNESLVSIVREYQGS